MAAGYVKEQVKLNLDATEEEWTAFEAEGMAALGELMSETTPPGSTVFFVFTDEGKKAAKGGDEAADPVEAKRVLRCELNSVPSGRNSRAMYFSKVGKVIPKELDSDGFLEVVDFGTVGGECLSDMAAILKEVYMPSIAGESADLAEEAASVGGGGGSPGESLDPEQFKGSAGHEFKLNVQRFEPAIQVARSQVTGEVFLQVPNVDVSDVKAAAEDYDVVNELELAMESWSKLITAVVKAENSKRPKSKGPLAEIEFWRQRNAALSALYEQINMPNVQQILAVLRAADGQMVSTFQFNYSELQKIYVEAKDNVKFLTTLERHFKNITDGSFSTILDTLPSMMNAIRMVWIISRHYNTDLRMVPLMERIAYKIAEKVETEIDIKTIVKFDNPEKGRALIDEARTVLNSWESTYMAVRQRIEESGTHIRWEFDRKRLFELTKYMAHVCGHLYEVATVLDQFHKFLGPELKAVTGESDGIDEVIVRVARLVEPLESVPFNIFDRRYKESWAKVMENFHDDVEHIEEMTRSFIEQSFQKLRSATGAFELVENFRHIQSRESINKQINDRYKDILHQYTKELEAIDAIFVANKHDAAPKVYKNFPPVAGAVAWARDLYQRAKQPVLRFKAHEGLLQTEYGEQVKQKYLTFARSVDAYITALYREWEAHVQHVATEKLKQPILAAVHVARPAHADAAAPVDQSAMMKHANEAASRSDDDDDDDNNNNNNNNINNNSSNAAGSPFTNATNGPTSKDATMNTTAAAGTSKGAAANQQSTSKKGPNRTKFKMPPPPYRVNFAAELSLIIRESKYLDRMGFAVPDAALNVTLQEDKYHSYRQNLGLKLRKYDALVASLSKVESELLVRQLASLQRVLKTGFTPLNWNSQRIPSFIESCDKALNEFQGVVSQIQKSSMMIDEVVTAIDTTLLAQLVDVRTDRTGTPVLTDAAEFYESLETKRLSRLGVLAQKYRSVESLLKKVEEVVATSNDGNSALLASYYTYWEKRIFNAIITMVAQSLAAFHEVLRTQQSTPFILVTVTLSGGKDLVCAPPTADVQKYFLKAGRNIIESAKVFTRWKRGSCLECPPVMVHEDEEPFVFSFFDDVARNAHVIDLQRALNSAIASVCATAVLTVAAATSSSSAAANNNLPGGGGGRRNVSTTGAPPLNTTGGSAAAATSSEALVMSEADQQQATTGGGIASYLESWTRYEREYKLWDVKALQQLEKLKDKEGLSFVFFDSKLAEYASVAEEVGLLARARDIDFVHVDCAAVAEGIAAQAGTWRDAYGDVLQVASRRKMDALSEKMGQYEKDVDCEPEDLEQLKFVLNTITAVTDESMDMELAYSDVIERYRTLDRYGVAGVDDEERATAMSLGARWRALYCAARTKDLRLAKVKDQFREVTTRQAADFLEETKLMYSDLKASGPASMGVTLEEGAELMADALRSLAVANARKLELVNAESLFDLPITPYPVLAQVVDEVQKLGQVYALFNEFREFRTTSSEQLWGDLDVTFLKSGADQCERKARKLPSALKDNPKFREVEVVIQNFKESLPVIVNLKNDAMKDRHWTKISETTGVAFDNAKLLTLGKVFAMELQKYAETIDEIVLEAVNELKIENEIRAIESTWASTNLDVRDYSKDGKLRGHILGGADEIRLALEDNMLNLQTMAGSRFVGAFSQKVRAWEKSLNQVNETLEVWFNVQRQWMYLESIFIGSEDIRLQLPDEAKKFDVVNKTFKGIMTATNQQPNVIKACTANNMFETLTSLGERLDKCQKSLTDYLDTKRKAFARFYFISDDELLSILGSSDPTSIQIHMLKLFDNVKELKFARNAKAIGGMSSSENEAFAFPTPSPVEGAVEHWMTKVEEAMKDSLHTITKTGIYNYGHAERIRWIRAPETVGMVSLVGSQIWWTWEVEDAFDRVARGDKHGLKNLEAKLTGQLVDLVALVREDLDRLTRKKVNALLIIDVHARDIVDGFIRESVLKAKEFEWESQLRFYWDRDVDDCTIHQCTGTFRYGYEYQGLNGRLVITPLTDRCYMTLTQALTFKLGGSPAGPAGTGKTETVKDLAKSLALSCVVINCGDGLDYKAMASIFSGLVQCGAWGCFDEFNRINIEVLSVVSAQLRSIQNALIYDKPSCDIGNGEILVRRVAGFATCGFFITMNPGYAGRTVLPDNLKALFRPVTMIVPDLLMICEIMLFSEGFEGAKVLARKMTVLYKLSREQLSKQYHYDFGLRSLKSVLVMAGGLKREYSDLPEDIVLMRVLRDSNMPKYVFEDVPLFRGLITDLFPGLDTPRVGYEHLKVTAAADLEKGGYRCTEDSVHAEQVDKVIQMYETMIVRHTTMIVGPTGGGKTLVLDTLKNARLAAENIVVKMFVLNPKAQPTDELYGVMDPETRDWTDGVLSRIFRELNEPLPKGRENEMRWIIYDGDVDAVWVENMNSVMDDNKLLTLPNGERIRLQPHCAMICETFDLQYASPATISRCGMVWVDPKNLGYRPFYERWLKQRRLPEEDAQQLTQLFEQYVPKCMDYVQLGLCDGDLGEKLKSVVAITSIDMVKQLCTALDAFLEPIFAAKQQQQQQSLLMTAGAEGLSSAPSDAPPPVVVDGNAVENIYTYCITWSLGAALLGASRERFHAFVRKLNMSGVPSGDGLLTDYVFDVDTMKWEKWSRRVPDYVEPAPFRFYEVIVPTTDSCCYKHLLENFAPRKPLLLVGGSGTAKTAVVNDYLSSLAADKVTRLTLGFSSRTSSRDVQTNVEANVDKRAGAIYGPPVGKSLAIFIDDLNMPKVDTYGTQQPITLLLTLISRGFVYDRDKDLNQKLLRDLTYIGAMGPPGGGRNKVDPRFVALFSVFNVPDPTQEVLSHIYTSIISARCRDFSPDIQQAAAKFPPAMLSLFEFVVENLPPTPAKFHYIFNLRDLSRVTEGVCLATDDAIQSVTALVRLFRNEMLRIFCDRLISDADLATVQGKLGDLIGGVFPDCREAVMADPCVFGDYRHAVRRLVEDAEDPRIYEDMGGGAVGGSLDETRKIFDGVMEAYNVEHKPMTLVLFEQALLHLTRIHRIIRMQRGNVLLVGVGGSGKQSLTRLAAFCAGSNIFSISLVRNYGEWEFREDLKRLYTMLGLGEVVFLFTDAHVAEEGFLEFVNNMLTTGMVPALYEKEESDMLCNSVRKEVRELGVVDTPDNLWKHYVNKCRNNLHIVLAMSPSGEKLRLRCRSFPGLISNAVIDWFFPWPEDALTKVANYFLAEVQLPAEKREAIVSHLVYSHQHVVAEAARFATQLRRHYYVTPKNYLDYIHNYHAQLSAHEKRVDASVKRLSGGLSKLVEAAKDVDRMSIELTEAKVIVDAKTVDVEALITQIQSKTKIANEQKAEAEVKQKAAGEQAVLIAQERDKANEALNEALPALAAAEQALENLHKEDITEIKNFAKPPKPVMDVCLMVVCLRPTGEKLDETWGDAKKMLSNQQLLAKLKSYPKDSITEKMMKGARKYLKDPNLTIEKMATISKAGNGLLTWVLAISKYYDVAKNVEPLRAKVREMEKGQAKTEKELGELNAMLAELTQELEIFNQQYAEKNGELANLQTQAALMEKRLTAASKLISGLTGERTRWTADIERLKGNKVQLVGDCLLAASFLSYAGAFTNDYRTDIIYDTFLKKVASFGIPVTATFSVEALLTTDAIVQSWTARGLPADEHSIQNGILTTASSRFPLCIDPQQQAVSWIKSMYGKDQLKVKTLSEADFMKHLELAIQFGSPFLFENVDEDLDPMLDPVLEQNTYVESGTKLIKLGDKAVAWDDAFRLFLTTKLANPHYSPEVMSKTMIINYSVTGDGLSNQLLNVVVAHERPDLEQQYAALVSDMSESALLIVQLEDTLLRELSSSSGNILDNEDLIATLDETKTKAEEIKAKLDQSKFTKDEISKARSGYQPVAKRGSILYFVMASLSTINAMYETSLDSFLGVFHTALDRAKKDVVLDARLRNMRESIMREIYDYTCTGIFERHKLMFAFQMTCRVQDGEGTLERVELDFFLKGDTGLAEVARKSPAEWLSPTGWKDLLALGSAAGAAKATATVQAMIADFEAHHAGAWKDWYDLEAPEAAPVPDGHEEKLTPMQRLCVMRCFRPDRVYNAVKLYVIDAVGEKYVQPPVLDYGRIYQQSNERSPMVFILSPGADPQADIQLLCDERGFSSKFRFIALGQGQGPKAESLIDQGTSKGHWVLLQNAHLLVSWLKKLEKRLELMKAPHKDFRLWLTTEPTDKFPLGILQRSLKVVTEPPDGLKLNMRATYSKIDQAVYDECPHSAFSTCLFVLAWLHAVVQERRKYGKIGWNVAYDFNESDFQISRRLLALYLNKAREANDEFLPWGSLKYLIGDAMYGGRVSDSMDRRVLSTYLQEYMGDFLFDSCQKFYFSRAGFDYTVCAPTAQLDEFPRHIEALPLTNSPAVFGLHPNAEIGFYTNATKSMWRDLISLQPRTGGTETGLSRDDVIAAVAKDIKDKVPVQSLDIGSYDPMVVRSTLFTRNGAQNQVPTPCQVVLLQEIERWNALVIRMAITLIDLQRAFRGEIGMSDDLDDLGASLFDGFIPASWAKLAPATLKPLGSWMASYLARHAQYESWINTGEPCCIWLSGLHIPESYLTALVQTTCRMKNWPLDKSTQQTQVTHFRAVDDIPDTLNSGTYVSGLYLEGASWNYDECCLARQDPKVLVVELPILCVTPIEAARLNTMGTFLTPVYVTQARRNAMGVGLVFEAALATTQHLSHWVLQGVALSLNTDT